MYIDEALERAIATLNSVMIPASESGKIEKVKRGMRDVINSVREMRERQQAEREERERAERERKEESGNENHA